MRFVKWKVIRGQRSWPCIILKWIWKEYDDETTIWIRTVASSGISKYFNELLSATERGKFLVVLGNC